MNPKNPSNSGSHPVPLNPNELQRLHELLADERLDQLSVEDRAELETLCAKAGTLALHVVDPVAELAVRLGKDAKPMPVEFRERLLRQGLGMIAGAAKIPASVALSSPRPTNETSARLQSHAFKLPVWVPIAFAASLGLASVLGFFGWRSSTQKAQAVAQVDRARQELETAKRDNIEVLVKAQSRADELAKRVAESLAKTGELDKKLAAADKKLADAAAREVRLAQDLNDATQQLGAVTLRIAKYEQPADPKDLIAGRTKLLESPGSIKVAWKNFDLPDAPAEQRLVTGDVVWNDELDQGYLRFVGLRPNDPKVEQYQVWVIDERGMEQKVSGGVFNANAAGEIIVPITPAIAMRKVALFAITIEEPGGTWVPSLKRRVVVAPRGG